MRFLIPFILLTCLSVKAQITKNGTSIYYLDSGSNHYLQLDSIGTSKHPDYRVREYYRNTLLSSGKTNWLPDIYLNQIRSYSVRTYQNLWHDTILILNFLGDTIQYAYNGDINKSFEIKYTNNRRTVYERFGKHRVTYQWVKDGIIEKHYKHRFLYKLVLRPNDGPARTFYYKRSSLAYYYSPSEDLYASFSTDVMHSTHPKYFSIARKLKNRQYLLVYPSENRFQSERTTRLYQDFRFPKKQYRQLRRHMGKFGDRYDLEQLIVSKDTLPSSNSISVYTIKNRLVYYKLETTKPDTAFYELYFKSRIGKKIYRYQSDHYHGHIDFKRHSFKHIDTIVNRGKTYITKGVYKHNFYYYTTYCNQTIYRHGKLSFYNNYRRPKGLNKYSEDHYKSTAMEDIYPYIHGFNAADIDTFFFRDTTIIFDNSKIILRTAGIEKILFDSIYDNTNRIIKDQAQCAVGLKTLDDKWLIPPAYDHIENFQLPGSNARVYFASVNDYGALYNQKGQLMIPPTKGLSSITLPLSLFYSSSLDIINQYAFICNDLTKDSFKLIDQFNRVVLQGAGKYNYFHDMLGIKHQGNVTYNNLNTDHQQHWFKDTIAFIGRDEALLWELQPNAQGRQLRLLNTANYELATDTFCIFHKDKNNLGIESGQRRIYYSNGHKYLMDSQRVSVESFYQIGDFLILKNGEKYGLAEDNKIILPPVYDAIRIGGGIHAAFKDSNMYFVNRNDGKIIKNLEHYRLSTKSPKGVSEYPNFEFVFNDAYVIDVNKDGKLGLVDHLGNDILPCQYNYLNLGYHLYNVEVDYGEAHVETRDQDSVMQSWKFVNGHIVKTYPKQPLMYIDYNDYKNSHFYIGFSGQKHRYKFDFIEQKSSQINTDLTTYNCYKIIDTTIVSMSKYSYATGMHAGNRKLIGVLDEKLEWIMRFDTFENIEDQKTFFYFTTKDKRSGVMDRNFKTIIPAQYHYISYDPNRHWLWHKNEQQTYWQLTNLDLDTCISDSIDYPIQIDNNEETGVFTRNGYYGLINTLGKIIVNPEYERISELSSNQNPRVFFKNNTYYTRNYYNLQEQPYQKLYMPEWALRSESASQHLIGRRGQTAYIVTYLNTKDSSEKLFINKDPSTLLYYRNWLTKINKEYSSTPEILQRKIRIFFMIEQAAVERHFYWHSPTPVHTYPEKRREEGAVSSTLFSGTVNEWAPATKQKDSFKVANKPIDYHLTLDDFAGKRYELISEGVNTMTYRSKNYMHLVFDSSSVYKFTLYDIIDPSKKDSLNNYLHKLWLKQENPNLACVPANQIFDMFNSNFYMSGPSFLFLPHRLDLLVRIEEMKAFMSAEWAARF